MEGELWGARGSPLPRNPESVPLIHSFSFEPRELLEVVLCKPKSVIKFDSEET